MPIKANTNTIGIMYVANNDLSAITLLDTGAVPPVSRLWDIFAWPDNLSSAPPVTSSTNNPAAFTPPAAGECYVVRLTRTLVGGSEVFYLLIVVFDADGLALPCPGLDASPSTSLVNQSDATIALGWAGGGTPQLGLLSASLRKIRADAIFALTPASGSNAGTMSAADFTKLASATAINTAGKIVERDGSGNIAVSKIAATEIDANTLVLANAAATPVITAVLNPTGTVSATVAAGVTEVDIGQANSTVADGANWKLKAQRGASGSPGGDLELGGGHGGDDGTDVAGNIILDLGVAAPALADISVISDAGEQLLIGVVTTPGYVLIDVATDNTNALKVRVDTSKTFEVSDNAGHTWLSIDSASFNMLGPEFTVTDNTTAVTWVQNTRGSTGANAGLSTQFKAQAGQAQTGGANNNNGGNLELFGGDAGTGGGGTAGKPGDVILDGTQVNIQAGTAKITFWDAGSSFIGVGFPGDSTNCLFQFGGLVEFAGITIQFFASGLGGFKIGDDGNGLGAWTLSCSHATAAEIIADAAQTSVSIKQDQQASGAGVAHDWHGQKGQAGHAGGTLTLGGGSGGTPGTNLTGDLIVDLGTSVSNVAGKVRFVSAAGDQLAFEFNEALGPTIDASAPTTDLNLKIDGGAQVNIVDQTGALLMSQDGNGSLILYNPPGTAAVEIDASTSADNEVHWSGLGLDTYLPVSSANLPFKHEQWGTLKTTGNTAGQVLISYVPPQNCSVRAKSSILVRKSTGETSRYERTNTYHRETGNVTSIGQVTGADEQINGTISTASCALTANATTAIQVQVTGITATTLSWTATLELTIAFDVP